METSVHLMFLYVGFKVVLIHNDDKVLIGVLTY